ncbi:Crotonobetainyl-CoA:carnitine CoA-transferase CaiB [Cohaesibacter sp. ES.047]|uniref:CaiB/BaiF CoA transferase family protein n=1 Tax=Cohaesibacter sp. ES.047 TaxID=1798205 RepID=UPI000BB7AF80|nr:CaiB/BaiF CoA-transferase family protein [Cohaesibacter sp. ES.047]SNY91130.1 Crotonobetainyl-CoA:carnitine CoA-transferase CaiB [Cohaesibacter sp. ES.047]
MTQVGPLDGIRVIDFGHTVMGPCAALILADLGADVIRVEPAGKGDPTRRLKGFGTGYFPFFNRNKRSLSVDLKSPEGLKVVKDLLSTADVLIENFGPGTIDRLGLGYDALKDDCPRLIYLSLKGFLPGLYEKRTALDEVVQMMSGLAYMTGPPGQPLRAGSSVIDIMGGMFGVIAVLAALRERDSTGKGQLVRSSLFESAVFLMGQHLAYASYSDRPVPPMPARVSAWAIYDQFHTLDDETVFLGVTSDRQWPAFCRAFDRDDLLENESLKTNGERIDAADWLKPDLAAMIKDMTLAEVERRALEAEVPFAHVARPEDLFDHPHLSSRHGLLPTMLPGGVQSTLPALPLEMERFQPGLHANPPLQGADSAAILAELGLSSESIAHLIKEGIVVTQQERAEK